MHIHIVLATVLAATLSVNVGAENADPWEGVNRKTFAFNDFFDTRILRPVAKGYERVVPKRVRKGVSNVFDNVDMPGTAINQFLQGKPRQGLSDSGRFLINTTLGIVGIFDVATQVGLPKHQEDFGQTLGVWGVQPGPFLVAPFIGSSTVRDTVGGAVSGVLNPLNLISPGRDRAIAYSAYVIDLRTGLFAAEQLVSGDKYLFLRDTYLQRRAFLVSDGELTDDDFDGGFDDDEFEDFDEYED